MNKTFSFIQNNITCRDDLLKSQTFRDRDEILPNGNSWEDGTSEPNFNLSQTFTTGSESISRTSTATSGDNLHLKLNVISAFRRTAAKEIIEKKWRGAFISYDYTGPGRPKKFSKNKVIHDKPSLPIWILAMMAYLCVIVIVVIAMYLYQWPKMIIILKKWIIKCHKIAHFILMNRENVKVMYLTVQPNWKFFLMKLMGSDVDNFTVSKTRFILFQSLIQLYFG